MESIFNHYTANESLYTAIVSPVCEKYSLTYMEFTVLMFLANNPRVDTASAIVRCRHLTKSHVSMSIRNLEKKGLIKGAYHEPNRKAIHLTVLDAAEKIVSDGRKAQQFFREILFSDFSDFEYNLFTSFIKRIDKNISDHWKLIQNKQEEIWSPKKNF